MTEKIEEQKSKTISTLGTMLEYLGLDAKLRAEERNSKIVIKILSEDAGRIIGRKGQTLESLQMLLNRMLFNKDTEFPRITLDIDGYAGAPPRNDFREKRENFREERDDRNEHGGRDERRSSGYSRNRDFDENESDNGDDSDNLRQQALDSAKEAKRWGEPVTLPRLNARDRRIVHITLQDDSEIITESVGEGSLKKVVISVKK
ncbi:MAG: KH domain-containing protein [Victivallaceae bacterium]|nr:KH domain-containing protein [Victivallaceae bacterium]